jgi:hypothetical protein
MLYKTDIEKEFLNLIAVIQTNVPTMFIKRINI